MIDHYIMPFCLPLICFLYVVHYCTPPTRNAMNMYIQFSSHDSVSQIINSVSVILSYNTHGLGIQNLLVTMALALYTAREPGNSLCTICG